MNEIIEENEIIRDPINAPPPEVRPFTDRENSLVEQLKEEKIKQRRALKKFKKAAKPKE